LNIKLNVESTYNQALKEPSPPPALPLSPQKSGGKKKCRAGLTRTCTLLVSMQEKFRVAIDGGVDVPQFLGGFFCSLAEYLFVLFS